MAKKVRFHIEIDGVIIYDCTVSPKKAAHTSTVLLSYARQLAANKKQRVQLLMRHIG